MAAAYRNIYLPGFIPRECVINCSTGPWHSDYTNISGNGPKIFPNFHCKAKLQLYGNSNSLTGTSACIRVGLVKNVSEGGDGNEMVDGLLWMWLLKL